MIGKLHSLASTALLLGGLSMVALGTSAVSAAEMASRNEISAAVSDKTLQGSMLSDTFSEFYAADGSIKGDGYGGKWTVTDEGMCFSYDGGPASCWGVELNGPALTLYKDGVVDGTGILVDGNPNNF